jgi:hypothetical protein
MPTFKFPYCRATLDITPAFPDGHVVYRPFVGAILRNGDRETEPFFGLVDTGADYCMFPSEYLTYLGIDKESLPPSVAMGVATDHAVRFANVTLELPQIGRLSVYAGFSDNLNGQGYGSHRLFEPLPIAV